MPRREAGRCQTDTTAADDHDIEFVVEPSCRRRGGRLTRDGTHVHSSQIFCPHFGADGLQYYCGRLPAASSIRRSVRIANSSAPCAQSIASPGVNINRLRREPDWSAALAMSSREACGAPMEGDACQLSGLKFDD